MKPGYIMLFILSVFALLAGTAAVFPPEGIKAGGTELQFPNLREIYQTYIAAPDTAEAPKSPSPEELLAMRAQEMRMAEEEEYIAFFHNHPARIQWPVYTDTVWALHTDSTGEGMRELVRIDTLLQYDYFDDLYAAFDKADSSKVRIAHYGDSQIEEDRISMILRRTLQERFGGGGPGLLPYYQAVPSRTIVQRTIPEPHRYTVFGPKEMRLTGSRLYGPLGQTGHLREKGQVRLSPREGKQGLTCSQRFNRLTVLARPEKALTLTYDGKRVPLVANGSSLQTETLTLPDSTTSLTLQIEGEGDIYGIALDNEYGVAVDNIPMRGCAGTIFTGMDAGQLRIWFEQSHTRLIILQFGGNAMPYLKAGKHTENYIASLLKQTNYLKRCAPEAVILFIGPSDMTTHIGGEVRTYPILAETDRKLAEAMTRHGVAYWSLFQSMGGEGSMQQWVHAGLAASDYVHFLPRGADEAGRMLTQALLLGYEYYDWRRDTERQWRILKAEADTIATDNTTYSTEAE